MSAVRKIKTSTPHLRVIKGGKSNPNNNTIENTWIFIHAALWCNNEFTNKEETQFQNRIAEHYNTFKNPTKVFEEIIERVCLAKRYVNRKRGRYLSKPIDWLNLNYHKGLTGTEGWYKEVCLQRISDEWLAILDKAWTVGIPHITFTGGEATLRDDLPVLINQAEKNGQVCGLLTDGLKLTDKKYLDLLLQTGLDHILFMLQPNNEDSWAALETIMPEDIFVTVHLTLNTTNAQNAEATLERLAQINVQTLSLTIVDDSLRDQYAALRNQAADLGLTLK